jgi:hypothetical protein
MPTLQNPKPINGTAYETFNTFKVKESVEKKCPKKSIGDSRHSLIKEKA